MKPRIRFELKDGIVYVSITVPGDEARPFSLGVSLDAELWHQKKQICGDPRKQVFLSAAKKSLEEGYLPGMTADMLWTEYQKTINESRAHTIREAFKYIVKEKKMSKSTSSTYKIVAGHVESFGHGGIHISAITPATIRTIMADIRTVLNNSGEPVSDGTVYTYYSTLCSAITFYSSSHGLAPQGSIEGIMKAPHIEKGKIQYRQDSNVQVDKLLELIKMDLSGSQAGARLLFLRQCLTGMAKVDVFNMKRLHDYIETDDNGKRWFVYTRHKTKLVCKIPMNETLEKNLQQFSWPIPFSDRQYNNILRELGKKLGISLSSHDGRHTFGVLMLEAGFTMEAVSKMMGHTSITITEQAYAKVTKKRIISEEAVAIPNLNTIFN